MDHPVSSDNVTRDAENKKSNAEKQARCQCLNIQKLITISVVLDAESLFDRNRTFIKNRLQQNNRCRAGSHSYTMGGGK